MADQQTADRRDDQLLRFRAGVPSGFAISVGLFRKRTDPRCSLALLEGLADARRAGTACRKCGMAGRRGKRHQYQADRVAARRCADARFGDGNESLIGDGTNDGCRTWHFGQADSPIVGGRQRRDGNQGDVWKP